MFKIILFIFSFISFFLLSWEMFNLWFDDVQTFSDNFLLLSSSFLQNFIVLFVWAIPIFAVYWIYRVIRQFT